MSEVEILSNRKAQHSEFKYKKTSVSMNPKCKEKATKTHGFQMQGDILKHYEANLQRRWTFKEVVRGGIPPKSSLPVSENSLVGLSHIQWRLRNNLYFF